MTRTAATLRLVVLSLASLAGVVGSAACNRAPLAGERLHCTSDSECPKDFICAESVSLCFATKGLDQKPPTVLDVSIDPAAATVGRTAVVRFRASEPLFDDPVVKLDSGALLAVAPDEGGGENAYEADLVVVGGASQAEGAHGILVDLVDATGNAATGIALSSIALDYSPPTKSGDAVFTQDESGLAVAFALSELVADAPSVSLVPLAGGAESPLEVSPDGASAAEALSWRAHADAATVADGTYDVVASAVDVAGNTSARIALGGVVIDTSAATTFAGALTIAPTPLLARPKAVPPGGRATLTFSTTEPVAAIDLSAVVCANAATPPFTAAVVAGGAGAAAFAYDIAVPVGTADDDCALAAHILDLHGNETDAAIVGADGAPLSLIIDGTPPAASSINATALELLRAPFGAAQTNGAPLLAVVNAGLGFDAALETVDLAPAFTDAATVRVLTATGAFLGEGAFDGGHLGFIALNTSDAASAFVTAVDGAGNQSAPVAIPFGELVATLGGKIAGSTVENPTELAVATRMPVARFADSFSARAATQEELDGISSPGGAGFVAATTVPAFVDVSGTGEAPSARSDMGFAYDSWRGEAVVFGGFDLGGVVGETWTFSNLQWRERHPASAPPARALTEMAFDEKRGVTVLFGGNSPNSAALGDTWEWDGTSWRERSPATRPPPRRNAAMAFDPVTASVVLFGGFDPVAGTQLGDTWSYDGRDWVELFPDGAGPPKRARPALLTLPGEGVLLVGGTGTSLAGGGGGFISYADTWRLDGNGWTQLDVAIAPPRALTRLFIDPGTQSPSMFGGFNPDLEPRTTDDGVYSLGADGGWARTGASIGGVEGNALFVDPALGLPLSFGGTDHTAFETDLVASVAVGEEARDLRVTATPVVAGGQSSVTGFLAASAYHPLDVRSAHGPHITSLPSTGITDDAAPVADNVSIVPGVLPQMVAGFDPVAQRVVIVKTSALASTTYVQKQDGSWQQLTTTAPGYWSGLVYDEVRNDLVGVVDTSLSRNGRAAYAELLNGESWAFASQGPASGAMVAWDRENENLVAFGGAVFDSVDETWTFDATTASWQQRFPVASPEARYASSMAWDEASRRVLMFGGQNIRFPGSSPRNAETWEWDGQSWSLASDGPMGGRLFAQLVDDDVYGAPTLRGGFTIYLSPHTEETSTFVWHGGALDRPAFLWTVPVGQLLPVNVNASSMSLRFSAVAGATGGTVGDTSGIVDGVELRRFSGASGSWRALASSQASDDAPALVAGIGDTSDVLGDGASSTVSLAVTSTAPGGARGVPATVVASGLELRVRYGVEGASPAPFDGQVDRPTPIASNFAPVDTSNACTTDADCGASEICSARGQCEANCLVDLAGCEAGGLHACNGRECVLRCASSEDCGNGAICNAGLCQGDCRTGTRCDPVASACCDTRDGFCGNFFFASDETWRWDGSSFTRAEFGGFRQFGAFDMQIARRRGPAGSGLVALPDPLDGTSRENFDGTSWSEDDTSPGPASSEFQTLIAIADLPNANGFVVLAAAAAMPTVETWRYNETTDVWTKLNASASDPPLLQGAAVATDASGRIVVFGGQRSIDFADTNDLFVLNAAGTAWTHATTILSGAPPSIRSFSAMALEPTTGKLFIHGGEHGAALGDSFHLTLDASNRATWTTAAAFAPRAGHAMAADKSGKIIIVGGRGTDFANIGFLDVSYTPSTNSFADITPFAGLGPSPREQATAAFDGVNTYFFGGDLPARSCEGRIGF
jgi:hypothetical protein